MRCHFSGMVEIGDFEGIAGGVNNLLGLPNGLYDSTIIDCVIGDCVLVKNVGFMRNARLDYCACVINCGVIDGSDDAELGTMALLNEGGGRQVPLSPHLTAAVAHVLCHYRHDEILCETLESKLHYTLPKGCVIGQNTIVQNCKKAVNVHFGVDNVIDGAELLENGHIGWRNFIGAGVIARNFVVQINSSVTDGAMLERTFVGQGCEIGKQFSAVDSAFFSNCQGFHGEACSLFAGPYTVTHHKSTLLIACQTSFFNAGSATNQSNHLYKLGPLHQGIMERGCKTASSSYVMWPGHIGAFSMVMGHHGKHLDTSALPFSYVLERDGKSYIMPGANLRSVGTWRDNDKWPKRDKRVPDYEDPLITDMLTPYTAQKILDAITVLEQLKAEAQGSEVHYKGCTIKMPALNSGLRLYRLALNRFVFDVLRSSAPSADEPQGWGAWVDWAGLVMPQSVADKVLDIMLNDNKSITDINEALRDAAGRYKAFAHDWVMGYLAAMGVKPAEALKKAAADANELDRMVLDDAQNDFADFTKIGYGIEGDSDSIAADFLAVRGAADDNGFLKQIRQQVEERLKFV